MGSPFRALRSGGVAVQLDARERAVLARLLDDVAGLLEPDDADPEGADRADAGRADADLAPDQPGEDGMPDRAVAPAPSGPLARATEPADVDAEWAQLAPHLEAAVAAPPPRDPAVRRLLPDGSRDDPELAESYRRLTEHTLRERKRSGLTLASAALTRADPLVLDPAEAQALLKGMTDVRLVIAERLGVRTDEDAELLHRALLVAGDDEDEWVTAAAVYDALTWWQESLVAALLP